MNQNKSIFARVTNFFRAFPLGFLLLFGGLYALSETLSAHGRAIVGLFVITGVLVWMFRSERGSEAWQRVSSALLLGGFAVIGYTYCIAELVGATSVKSGANTAMDVMFGFFALYVVVLLYKSRQLFKAAKSSKTRV